MTRIQTASGRWYQTPQGLLVPSVTTILSVYPKGERFQRWLADSASYQAAIDKRNAAGERGTLVHETIEQLLAGQTFTPTRDIDSKTLRMVKGFVNWYHDVHPEVIASELFVHTDEYAGTADFLGRIDGETWLIDWKTSPACYGSYHLQTAAYANAACPGEEIRRGVLLLKHNTKKGWQLVESDNDLQTDLKAFHACRTLYHHEYGWEPVLPKEKQEPEPIALVSGEDQ